SCIIAFFFFFFSSRRRHTRSKRDWSSDVCSSDLDIFNDGFGVTFVGFGIDIETVFMFPVAESLALFERGADPVFHFIKEGGAEGVTKESIVEVADITPEAIVTVTTFRNEAMDV